MIVCQKCGFQNANDDTFCQNPSCQTFLEWEGEQVLTTQQPAIRPEDSPPPAPPPAPPRTQPRPPTPASPPTPGRADGGDLSTQPFDPRAESLLAQPQQPQPTPGSRQPAAVRPSEGKPRPAEPSARRQPAATPAGGTGAPAPGPGQVPCPNCGWPIEPTWNFCHHCATSVSLPRIQVGGAAPRRAQRGVGAGERPFLQGGSGVRKGLRLALTLVALAAVLGAGAFAAIRYLGGEAGKGGHGTATTIPVNLVQVKPTKVEYSSQSGDKRADNTIDGDLATFWSRRTGADDQQQPFLRYLFDRPVKLARVQIAAGASGDDFDKRPRPQRIQLIFSDGSMQAFTLADKRGFQTLDFPPRTIQKVRLVILSTYAGNGQGGELERTSISEVKLWAQE